MTTRKDRPKHPELYGLSFEELILKAQMHLAKLLLLHFESADRSVIKACLEEMLWRQRRGPEPGEEGE